MTRLVRSIGAIAALAALALPASAALTNKYTFNNNNADDSVGGQHGVVVDNTGISSFTAGTIDLSRNNGAGSNQDFSLPTTVGAYVDLPNNVFRNAVFSGTPGQVSVEIWFTTQQNRNWAEVVVFGRSNGGEDIAAGGSMADYVAIIPQSGNATPGPDFRATTHSAAGLETPIIGQATPLPVNEKHHVVLTIDLLDVSSGPNGTAKLYLNNGAPVAAANQVLLDQIDDVNNWIGRSQWPDPLFDGMVDELRIHDTVLTAAQVAASFTTGPDPSLYPTLTVNRDTGAMTIANQLGSNLTLKGYSIGSAAGALNPATWTSIDADNAFDPDGTWTNSAATNLQLAESVTGGTQDGGVLAAGASRPIGAPWRKTRFEDLTFSYTLSDNSTGLGLVQYTGTAIARSDLNGDGAITDADWALFLPNAFTSLAAETTVGAALKGDIDGDKDNDVNDFYLFKADYIAANGLAAFQALGATVPEPGSCALTALAAVAIASRSRSKRRAA